MSLPLLRRADFEAIEFRYKSPDGKTVFIEKDSEDGWRFVAYDGKQMTMCSPTFDMDAIAFGEAIKYFNDHWRKDHPDMVMELALQAAAQLYIFSSKILSDPEAMDIAGEYQWSFEGLIKFEEAYERLRASRVGKAVE